MATRITIHDLLKMEVTLDMYTDYSDELCIAFVGPMKLTFDGMKRYGHLLTLPVWVDEEEACGIIEMDGLFADENEMDELNTELVHFFGDMAGYCSALTYARWFDDPYDED